MKKFLAIVMILAMVLTLSAGAFAATPADLSTEPEFDPNESYDKWTVVEYTIEDIQADLVCTVSAKEDNSEFYLECNFYGDDQMTRTTYDGSEYTVLEDTTGFMASDTSAILDIAIEQDLWVPMNGEEIIAAINKRTDIFSNKAESELTSSDLWFIDLLGVDGAQEWGDFGLNRALMVIALILELQDEYPNIMEEYVNVIICEDVYIGRFGTGNDSTYCLVYMGEDKTLVVYYYPPESTALFYEELSQFSRASIIQSLENNCQKYWQMDINYLSDAMEIIQKTMDAAMKLFTS